MALAACRFRFSLLKNSTTPPSARPTTAKFQDALLPSGGAAGDREATASRELSVSIETLSGCCGL